MKKTFILIFLMVTLRIFSSPVSSSDAQSVAEYFIYLNEKSNTVENVITFENDEQTIVAYIVNLLPKGFIAISRDTDIRPIIAFSFLNDFIFTEDVNNTLLDLLKTDMTSRLLNLSIGELPFVLENNSLWAGYLNHTLGSRDFQQWPGEETSTGGWLETTWHQYEPYNNFCPKVYGERSYAGCIAIALAQVLNYNEYIGNRYWTNANDGYTSSYAPGSTLTIDNDAMGKQFPYFEIPLPVSPYFQPLNTYLNDLRFRYSNQLPLTEDNIAALCFISGISTQTSYTSQLPGSGANSNNIELIEKFDYNYEEWTTQLTPINFIEGLTCDMKNAQPALILLTGHMVVGDGYRIYDDHERFFHLNFGWGESNPGGGLNPTEAWYDIYGGIYGNYDLVGSSLLHICPPGFNGIVSGNVQLTGGNGSIEDVRIKVGYKEIQPDINGNYEVEIYNGNYEVSAYLWGYDEAEYGEVMVIANSVTENINLELNEHEVNTIYIPTDYPTIQEGIDVAANGDIVIVTPGTYYGPINFLGKRISVVSWYHINHDGYYIDNTILTKNPMAGTVRLVKFENEEDEYSVLDGFTLTEGNLTGSQMIRGAGLKCLFSSPTLQNLKIINNTAPSGSAIDAYQSNLILRNVYVANNHNTDSEDSPVVLINNSNPQLENVIISNNDHQGIRFYNCNSTIVNSTILDNLYEGIYVSGTGLLSVMSSLVWGNDYLALPNDRHQILNESTGYVAVSYSDVQEYWPNVTNIYAEPYIDSDFQPIWDFDTFSPLIDAGYPSILDPDGTPSDIGAVRAIDHRIESVELMGESEEIKWLCFPVIDTLTADADLAENWLSDIWEDQTYLNRVDWVVDGNAQSIVWVNGAFTNPNHEFTRVQGYKFQMNQTYYLDVIGFLENPMTIINLTTDPITHNRDNWIGYYIEGSMLPLEALEAVLDDIDMIKTQDFTLTKEEDEWIGPTNLTLNYGDLVVVNCTNNCSFYWGEDGGGIVETESKSSSVDFTYTEEIDYVPVYVELDNQVLGNPIEIGLFVNNECKGAEVITDSMVQIRAYVMNDSATFDPGNVEFQLSYGSRSENTRINNFIMKGNLSDQGESKSLDFSINPQRYYLISLTDSGNNIPEVISTSLSQNYPNPFNPTTTINYSIAQEGKTELVIYNIKGQRVNTLVSENQESGHYQVVWNGRDTNNKQVSSGIYFYRLKATYKVLDKKMLMLK